MLDKHRVRLSFGRAAESYEQSAVLQNEIGQRVLNKLNWIKIKAQSILDLGCGPGVSIPHLWRLYHPKEYYALDFALPMLAQARLKRYGLKKAHCICADMEALPLADQSIDLIYSNLAFQWANAPQQLLKECWRVLKPNGFLIFSTLGPDTLKELKAAWSAADNHPHTSQFIDIQIWGDMLIQSGFVEPVLDVDRIEMHYDRVEDILNDLKQIGAQNARSDQNKGLTGKYRFQKMKQAYQNFCLPNGCLPASYEVIYAQAWKPEPPSVSLKF